MSAGSGRDGRLSDIDAEHQRRGNSTRVTALSATDIEHDTRLLSCNYRRYGGRQRIVGTSRQEPAPGTYHLRTIARLTAAPASSRQKIDVTLTGDVEAVSFAALPSPPAILDDQAFPADRTTPRCVGHYQWTRLPCDLSRHGEAGTRPPGTSGIERNRIPQARKIAFPIAGATAIIGASPPPTDG